MSQLDAVLAAWRELYGEGHAYVLTIRHDRARVLSEMGRHGEALAELDAVLNFRRNLLGSTHPDTVKTNESVTDLRSSLQ